MSRWLLIKIFGRRIDIDHARVSLNQNLTVTKIQDGGGRHPKLLIFGQYRISVVNEDICFKFDTLIDIDHICATVTQNSTFTKNQDGFGRHL